MIQNIEIDLKIVTKIIYDQNFKQNSHEFF